VSNIAFGGGRRARWWWCRRPRPPSKRGRDGGDGDRADAADAADAAGPKPTTALRAVVVVEPPIGDAAALAMVAAGALVMGRAHGDDDDGRRGRARGRRW